MIIRSISGVRGLIDSHLTTKVIECYARAFHSHLKPGLIFIGRDSRPSGEDLLDSFANELVRLGRDVIICGIVPTPTVQFMVERSEAAGGIIITASHNPIEWNGIKFVRSDGTFFHPNDCDHLFELFDKDKALNDVKSPGMVFPDQNSILKHAINTIELSCIDFKAIKKRQFKVVIDAVNGAGSAALPLLLEYLGCEVIKLYCEGNGEFKRGTEPLPENLIDLGKLVLDNNADVGFAVDPDADRLAVVDETGKPIGEEYTLVVAAEGYINNRKKEEIFVTNLSSSMALDKLAEKHSCSVERSAVGEINVVQKMLALNSELGGEGNGGVILKESHLGRDSLVGVAMVLNRMSQEETKISKIHSSLPQFHIMKDKIILDGVDKNIVEKKVKSIFSDAEINSNDGLKLIWNDCWIHIRTSNTEPIMRIYAEAPSKKVAEKLVEQVKNCI
tara:strand:+ start:875 stop:2212 length:1338 start_codon:yes stop_codon:yes gene_type:complete